ncbi:response regulator transcription factor, partial [Pseudomonas aeruginosa]
PGDPAGFDAAYLASAFDQPQRRVQAAETGADHQHLAVEVTLQGLADKEIAKELGLAPNTVRNHVATIYAKLDVHSRGEAIVWARERGFAPEPRNGNGRK